MGFEDMFIPLNGKTVQKNASDFNYFEKNISEPDF